MIEFFKDLKSLIGITGVIAFIVMLITGLGGLALHGTTFYINSSIWLLCVIILYFKSKKLFHSYKPLKDLKKGDVIKILYSNTIYSAKVLNNYPEAEKIYVSVMTLGWLDAWFFGGIETILSYKAPNFEDYYFLNK